jgi:uncharacterized membrane protein
MDKQQIVSLIQSQLAAGKITKEDLVSLASGAQSNQPQFQMNNAGTVLTKEENSNKLTHIFYSIGAIIAVVGVGILVAQNWKEIGFAGRFAVTIGISFVTYVAGFVIRNQEQKSLSQIMFTISAALAPLGSYVLLEQAGMDFTWMAQFVTAIILAVIFGTALFISKRNILVLITIGFISWAYYSIIMKVFGFDREVVDFLKLATMLLGASYILIGYGYQSLLGSNELQDAKEGKSVRSVLYGLGTLGILGAGIFVGEMFDLILIALIFGAFYGSVYLKSRLMLILGAIFLMLHMIKLTAEYFVDSVGWSVALIGVGFLVIGIGYVTFYLNKKFISAK